MALLSIRCARALHLLDQMEIVDQADKLPMDVSGGQQQRVAIARALANDPPVVVADEPTGNLDSKTAEAVFGLFERLVAQGKTILMVTHDIDLARRATRTLILSDGEIVEEYLARDFPKLTEEQLVWATRMLERQRFAPGAIVLEEHGLPDKFYIITKGQVEVLLHGASDEEIVVATLSSGQFFGEIELVRGGHNIATMRASPGAGVEVVTLEQATFHKLIDESAPMKAEIDHIVKERVAENVASRGKPG
jgi:ABC-type multidrug transport system ATPase subunit